MSKRPSVRRAAMPPAAPRDIPSDLSSPLSTRLWGQCWQDALPLRLTDDGITAISTTNGEIAEFVSAHFPDIYAAHHGKSPFLAEEPCPFKRRFYEVAMDVFAFQENSRTIGIFLGNPVDWNTYYLRHCAILPEYQNRRIYQRFLEFLVGRFQRIGVKRLEGDVSPAHHAHIHVLNKLGFKITGMTLSERWGALLKFTKFLDEKNESVFLGQFSYGVQAGKSS